MSNKKSSANAGGAQEKIKPFLEHGHYTSVHDAVFDVVMPHTPPNAFKVLMFVLRKTRGWKKEEDVLRYAEIKKGTGIKSDTTLAKELDWLLGKKLLLAKDENGNPHQKGTRRAPAYSLNRDFELGIVTPENEVIEKSTPENEVPSTPENGVSNNHPSQEPTPVRDADASASVMKNPGKYFSDLLDSVGRKPTDRERERCFVHLRQLVTKHSATREEMEKIVAKGFEAHVNGYEWWPRDLLNKVRAQNHQQGNIASLDERRRASNPYESMASTSSYRKF